jgi:alpha-glucosidase
MASIPDFSSERVIGERRSFGHFCKTTFMNRKLLLSLRLLGLGLVLIGVSPIYAQENFQKISSGLRFQLGRTRVELTATTTDVLRLSLGDGGQPGLAPSSFLAVTNPDKSVVWHMIKKDGWVGIQTAAGELLLNPQSGEWTLKNSTGSVLIPPHALSDGNQEAAATNVQIQLGWDKQQPIAVYGCGNGVNTLRQSQTTTGVANGRGVIPYYWSPAGYAVLTVSANDNRPAYWCAATNGDCVTWTFPGATADLYLMPAASLKDAARIYAHLTGRAPVPPRWTFGYLQSRWGWKDRAYIEDTLKHFQELQLPVDAFIYDFEWYTPIPDYSVPAQGNTVFPDFEWNLKLFPEPAKQIEDYKKQGVRFVGIRKPRLGQSDTLVMIRSNKWSLQANLKGDESRVLDFQNPDLRRWYNQRSANLIAAGVDGWWNDEGEDSYTTYFYWNLTEAAAWSANRPNQRLWTLNRALSPGMQRLGAAAWTGDIDANWSVLAATPAGLLNWSLAGMPYSACDIGGFTGHPWPEILTRWMQAGVFFPIMRAHSCVDSQPHFPWLFGTNALNAMRVALDLRYRLIPFYYSLDNETFATGLPLMRPLVMEFPVDTNVSNLTDEWMMGDSLLAAPVLHPENDRTVYLPAGNWFVFGTNTVLAGGQTLQVQLGSTKFRFTFAPVPFCRWPRSFSTPASCPAARWNCRFTPARTRASRSWKTTARPLITRRIKSAAPRFTGTTPPAC